MVGLGVRVPGVDVPGIRRERGEPVFLLRMPDWKKRSHAVSPALFSQCCFLSQVPGRALRIQKCIRYRTHSGGTVSVEEEMGKSH